MNLTDIKLAVQDIMQINFYGNRYFFNMASKT